MSGKRSATIEREVARLNELAETVMRTIDTLMEALNDDETEGRVLEAALRSRLLSRCSDCARPYKGTACPACGSEFTDVNLDTPWDLSDDDLTRLWGV